MVSRVPCTVAVAVCTVAELPDPAAAVDPAVGRLAPAPYAGLELLPPEARVKPPTVAPTAITPAAMVIRGCFMVPLLEMH
jgi:hypothetical protein